MFNIPFMYYKDYTLKLESTRPIFLKTFERNLLQHSFFILLLQSDYELPMSEVQRKKLVGGGASHTSFSK